MIEIAPHFLMYSNLREVKGSLASTLTVPCGKKSGRYLQAKPTNTPSKKANFTEGKR